MTRRDAVLRKDSSSPDTSDSVDTSASLRDVAAPAKQWHAASECARRSTFWYSLRSSIESLPTTWSPGLPSFALIRTSAVPATFDRAVPFESAPPAFDSDSPSVWRYTPFTIALITTLLPLIRAPPQISVLVTAADETTMLAVASLSAPRPFALLSAFAVPLIEVVAPIVTSPPAVTVPFTTVFVVCLSSDVALECTPEKRPAPPLEPDDAAVATWSPVGAPASALLPPPPSSFCAPLPVEVRSTMRYCRPEPAAVMFTPSAANVCVPIAPVREPEVMSIGAPPGASASWNVDPVWLRT